MKRSLLVPVGLLALIGAVISIAAWEPWRSHEREREVAWIETFVAWTDRIDAGLAGDDLFPGTECKRTYDAELVDAPARLVEVARIALEGCMRLRGAIADSDLSAGATEWYSVRDLVLWDLTDRRARTGAPEPAPDLAKWALPLAGSRPKVSCWSSTSWEELSEEWRLIRVDELWPIGVADKKSGHIHLAPEICQPLRRFFGGSYAPNLNLESLQLAEALVTLAHEAEHLRSPEASEAQVECVAIQRVRDLVRANGRSQSYEDLMTGLAWEVGYPDVPPEYRTAECHNGSPLDVRPETSVWP